MALGLEREGARARDPWGSSRAARSEEREGRREAWTERKEGWAGKEEREGLKKCEFPERPMVRTPHSHCQGPGFNPQSGN